MFIENESCSESIQESIQSTSSESQPRRKKIHRSISYIIILYHRPSPWPQNSPSIVLIRCIRKGDMIFLVFINLLSEVEVNFLDMDSSKDPPEIPECYKNLVDVFSKEEATSLSSHQDHLDHHISLMNDAKFIFDPIYNLSENELKVLKKYLEDKLFKDFICSSISSFDSPVLFIKKLDDSLCLCVDY